jgi:hypothetical protein
MGDEGVRGIGRDRQGSSGEAKAVRNAVTETLELRVSGNGHWKCWCSRPGKIVPEKMGNDGLTVLTNALRDTGQLKVRSKNVHLNEVRATV